MFPFSRFSFVPAATHTRVHVSSMLSFCAAWGKKIKSQHGATFSREAASEPWCCTRLPSIFRGRAYLPDKQFCSSDVQLYSTVHMPRGALGKISYLGSLSSFFSLWTFAKTMKEKKPSSMETQTSTIHLWTRSAPDTTVRTQLGGAFSPIEKLNSPLRCYHECYWSYCYAMINLPGLLSIIFIFLGSLRPPSRVVLSLRILWCDHDWVPYGPLLDYLITNLYESSWQFRINSQGHNRRLKHYEFAMGSYREVACNYVSLLGHRRAPTMATIDLL